MNKMSVYNDIGFALNGHIIAYISRIPKFHKCFKFHTIVKG